MSKIKLFGTSLWPQCQPVKEFLSENNIEFDYIDIASSIMNLKMFMALRDTSPAMKDVRAYHSVGVPLIVTEKEEFLAESIGFVAKLISEGDLD